MSRDQETTATNTAASQNKGFYDDSQNSYTNANADIGDYEKQLSTYSAANPYGQGGQDQTATNQQLTNTADASAQAAGDSLQSQALRTGQNTAGGVAATEDMQQQNERTLSGQEAAATQQRIGAGADYGKSVLGASEVPAQLQTTIAGQQAGDSQNALGTEQKAGETPSWMDELGDSIANAPSAFASGAGKKICWVAAELYGGWEDPRTIAVRSWLLGEFSQSLFGRVVTSLYLRWGEEIAAQIHKHPCLRFVFLPIFNRALRAAQKGVI